MVLGVLSLGSDRPHLHRNCSRDHRGIVVRWSTWRSTSSRRSRDGRSDVRCSARTHPAGWISGALIGYGLTCVAFWAVLALRLPSRCGLHYCLGRCRGRDMESRSRPRSAASTAGMESRRGASADPSAVARAGCLRLPLQEPRCAGCIRESVLSRLFHRRLRLAYGADG